MAAPPFEPRTQCCGLNIEPPLRQAWHTNIDPGGARGGTKVSSQLHNKIHVACSWYVVTSSSSFYLRNFFLQLSGSFIILHFKRCFVLSSDNGCGCWEDSGTRQNGVVMEGGSARQHADAGGRAAAAAGRRAGEIAGGVLAGGRRHGRESVCRERGEGM